MLLENPVSHRRSRSNAGFTLIELIVVIAVIAVLASLVAPNVFRHVSAARDTTARSQVEMLGAALDAYQLDLERYPTTAEGLEALLRMPPGAEPGRWKGPYLRKNVIPADPWGHPYRYLSPGVAEARPYDLVSYGADGQPGGEGDNADITSWQ
jgi:general secretion pathway protein G